MDNFPEFFNSQKKNINLQIQHMLYGFSVTIDFSIISKYKFLGSIVLKIFEFNKRDS